MNAYLCSGLRLSIVVAHLTKDQPRRLGVKRDRNSHHFFGFGCFAGGRWPPCAFLPGDLTGGLCPLFSGAVGFFESFAIFLLPSPYT
jgi:hypothetical protein